MQSAQLAEFRNQKLGFVFQFHNLLPEFTAIENVMMPGLIAGRSKGKLKDRAKELLNMLGMASLSASMAGALSGGEQQRVAVARALMNKPMVIFADEPSGNLDSKNAEALHDLFFELRKSLGQTIILVTHNSALAQRCDRVITMADGQIIDDQVGKAI
jgi:lipoprotein-releasing system ATP-binding protein